MPYGQFSHPVVFANELKLFNVLCSVTGIMKLNILSYERQGVREVRDTEGT